MRPNIDGDIVRAAVAAPRSGLKTIEFDAWRQLDSSSPTTPQISNPTQIRARTIGAGASAAQYKAIYHLEKPTKFKATSPDFERILCFSPFGYGTVFFSVNNPSGPNGQGFYVELRVRAILDDFEPDLATWDNKVTAPDVAYDSIHRPVGNHILGSDPLQVPTAWSSSDVLGASVGIVTLSTGVTNLWSVLPFGKYFEASDKTAYGFLVEIDAGMVGSIYGGGVPLTNWMCTLLMSIGASARLHGPRIDW